MLQLSVFLIKEEEEDGEREEVDSRPPGEQGRERERERAQKEISKSSTTVVVVGNRIDTSAHSSTGRLWPLQGAQRERTLLAGFCLHSADDVLSAELYLYLSSSSTPEDVWNVFGACVCLCAHTLKNQLPFGEEQL